MAGRVMGGETQQYEETPNKVLGVTEVKMMAVKYTGSGGQMVDAISLVFGKAADNKPGVFILLDADKMRDNLTVASSHIREGVLEALGKADTRASMKDAGGDTAAAKALGGD
jgi:hypothetical protein